MSRLEKAGGGREEPERAIAMMTLFQGMRQPMDDGEILTLLLNERRNIEWINRVKSQVLDNRKLVSTMAGN